jgi:hypothetical protein
MIKAIDANHIVGLLFLVEAEARACDCGSRQRADATQDHCERDGEDE